MAWTPGNQATQLTTGTAVSFSLNNNGNFVVAIFLIRDDTISVSSATYAGQAMTRAIRRSDATDAISLEIWHLLNAPTGANTLAATLSASVDARNIGKAFSDGASGGELGATTGASSTTVNITPTANDSLLVSGLISEDGTLPTTGADETVILHTDEGTWATGSEYVIKVGGLGVAHTMNYGGPVAADSQIVAVEYKIAGGAAPTTNFLSLLGVGT